jgi:uncharacterized protein VirK/YbjX
MSAEVCGEKRGLIFVTRRIRFLFKALAAYRSVGPMIEAPRESSLGRLMCSRPQIVGAVLWPYQCSGWNVRTRFERIRDHCSIVEQIGGAVDFPVEDQISLLDLGEIREGFHVVVDQSEWFMREGQLSISLFLGNVRMYVLAFSFFHHESVIAAFVGAIQGRDIEGALDTYRELTKVAHGMRPRDFLIEIFRMFCAELGIAEIFAVSDEYRHHRNPYFGQASAKKFTTNYNDVWTDRGGVRVDPMCYRLDVFDQERDLSTVPSKKRGLYRRRFEMLRRIRDQMRDRCRSLAIKQDI